MRKYNRGFFPIPGIPTNVLVAVVGIVLGIAVILGFGAWIKGKDEKILKQNTELAQNHVVIETQKDAIDKDKKSDAVNEGVNLQVSTGIQTAAAKHEKAAKEGKKKEEGVTDTFLRSTQTVEDLVKYIEDLSAARIATLRLVYCANAAGAEGCPKIEKKG